MDATTLRIGFGRADITPQESVPIGGYGNASSRWSNNVLDPLMATCVALTDANADTLLIFSMDMLRTFKAFADGGRALIEKELGVPADHVMVSATHSHSTPDIGYEVPVGSAYYQLYAHGMLNAAKQAMEDREEARIFINRGQVNGMNYVRHYVQENGAYCGANFGDYYCSPIIGHTTPADPGFQIVKFTRPGKKDIVMLNWQVHPCLTAGMRKYDISADYIGALRTCIEEATGAHFVFFQGAAGNLVTKSRVPSETKEWSKEEFGAELAKQVLPSLKDMQQVRGGPVKVINATHTHPVNHLEDSKVPEALEVRRIWNETRDYVPSEAYGKEHGINSIYHAAAIIRKAKMGKEQSLEISAASAGDISFAFASYEMFCDNGVEIKEGTPFKMTFVHGCSNSNNGYLPTRRAFEYSCYEANTTDFAPGIGESLSQKFVQMLCELKEQ